MNAYQIYRIVFVILFFMGWGLSGNAAELSIRLENPPSSGMVAFVLFDSANAFGDLRDPALIVKLPLDDRDIYHIDNIPSGEYALLVYFDENNNGQIDRNFIGIPIEPLGFSNSYQPKGPPSYSRAAFVLAENEARIFDVTLSRPLGEFGRIGVGVGVIARSSPYRGYSGGVAQLIPAITYTGNRFQIFGPYAQAGLVGSGKFRLAVTGSYRIGVYEEAESDFLTGMGDRKSTFMAGLAIQTELAGGMGLSAGYEHDVLDRIGGGAAQLSLDKSFQWGVFRFSPGIGLNWLGSDLSTHDFGVPADKATAGRVAYDPGDTLSVEAGLGLFIEIASDWLIIMNASAEFLDNNVTDSPIISKDYVIKGFGALNYVF